MNYAFGTFVLTFVTESAYGSTKCHYNIDTYDYDSYSYCSNGCCNSDSWDPCCYNYHDSYLSEPTSYYYKGTSAAGVAGIVIGCIVAGCVFVGICICACNAIKDSSTGLTGGQIIRQPQIFHTTTTNTQRVQPVVQSNTNNSFHPVVQSNTNYSFHPDPSAPQYPDDFSAPPSYEAVMHDPKYIGSSATNMTVLDNVTCHNDRNISDSQTLSSTWHTETNSTTHSESNNNQTHSSHSNEHTYF